MPPFEKMSYGLGAALERSSVGGPTTSIMASTTLPLRQTPVALETAHPPYGRPCGGAPRLPRVRAPNWECRIASVREAAAEICSGGSM